MSLPIPSTSTSIVESHVFPNSSSYLVGRTSMGSSNISPCHYGSMFILQSLITNHLSILHLVRSVRHLSFWSSCPTYTDQTNCAIESKVKADWGTYPEEIQSRLHLLSTGDPSLEMSLESYPKAFSAQQDAFIALVKSEIVPKPTRFILDQMGGNILTPHVRDKYPDIPVYMHWSPSTTSLYTFVGKSLRFDSR